MSSLSINIVTEPSLRRTIVRQRATLYFPFGVVGAQNILREWKNGKYTVEEILMAQVAEELKLKYRYTNKDIEMIKKEDDFEGQIKMWIDRNRKMLSFGKGGVYTELIFDISPRTIEEEEL